MISKIQLPLGFKAAGINCGVRKYRPDVGLIVSELPCAAAGTFTKNSLKAWPVLFDQNIVPSDSVKAIICNSGQANVGTGLQGQQDNLELAERVAKHLGLTANQVLVASTGVVGDPIDMKKVLSGVDDSFKNLFDTINNFSLAIMTTDLVPKAHMHQFQVQGKTVTLTGSSKGSGMIHPNMATMLAFVVSDVKISGVDLQKVLSKVVDETFNMISVDGETSTNDSVLALANGASGVELKTPEERDLFETTLRTLLTELSKDIARDGEGASKLITVNITGAKSLELARSAARMVTTSPLVKSAIHGEDPNWGRILVRLGMAEVDFETFGKLTLSLQNVPVYAQGAPVIGARDRVRDLLKTDSITIDVDLKSGPHQATAWGCDLTKRYVDINTAYS